MLDLYSNRTFDLACAGDRWIGGGRYREDGDFVHFAFTVLHRNRIAVSHRPAFSVRIDGPGNDIVLINDAGQKYRLHRGFSR